MLGLVGRVSKERLEQEHIIDITFSLAEQPSHLKHNRIFVALDKEQSAHFKAFRERFPEHLGESRVSIVAYPEEHRLFWRTFSPFGIDSDTLLEHFKAPQGKGIATAIHAGVTEFLAEHYPRSTIRHVEPLPLEVSAKLAKRGINRGTHRIESYRDLVREYAQKRRAA